MCFLQGRFAHSQRLLDDSSSGRGRIRQRTSVEVLMVAGGLYGSMRLLIAFVAREVVGVGGKTLWQQAVWTL